MPDRLRLTSRSTVRALRLLYKAGPLGAPDIWVSRQDLVDLGYAERITTGWRAYRWRVRLTDRGRKVVETLINPKE